MFLSWIQQKSGIYSTPSINICYNVIFVIMSFPLTTKRPGVCTRLAIIRSNTVYVYIFHVTDVTAVVYTQWMNTLDSNGIQAYWIHLQYSVQFTLVYIDMPGLLGCKHSHNTQMYMYVHTQYKTVDRNFFNCYRQRFIIHLMWCNITWNNVYDT